MRILLCVGICVFTLLSSFAQTRTYHIRAHFDNHKNKRALLAFRTGLGLFGKDSLQIDMAGNVDVHLHDILPGWYSISVPTEKRNKSVVHSLILDNDTLVEFTVDVQGQLRFNPQSENGVFYAFVPRAAALQQQASLLLSKLSSPDAVSDSFRQVLADSLDVVKTQLSTLSADFKQQYPKHIYSLLQDVLAPQTKADVQLKTAEDSARFLLFLRDSFFSDQYWGDARLRRMPSLYENFNLYFDRVVPRNVDSLSKYVNLLGGKIRPHSQELFADFAGYIYTKYVRATPFHMSDAIFYRLYEKMISPEDNPSPEWARLKSFGQMLTHNQIGMTASPIRAFRFPTRQEITSDQFGPANLYVLAFWDPYCHHCQVTIPRVDSAFLQTQYAKKHQLKFVSITLEGKHGLEEFIRSKKLSDQWLFLFDDGDLRNRNTRDHIIDFRISYGIFQTPTFYILDRNKRILVKNIPYGQLYSYLDTYLSVQEQSHQQPVASQQRMKPKPTRTGKAKKK